jgi:hypothetical protein
MRLYNANFFVGGTLHVEEGYFKFGYDFERDIVSRFSNANNIHIWII